MMVSFLKKVILSMLQTEVKNFKTMKLLSIAKSSIIAASYHDLVMGADCSIPKLTNFGFKHLVGQDPRLKLESTVVGLNKKCSLPVNQAHR